MRNNGKLAEKWFEDHWVDFGKTAYCCRLADHHAVKYQGGVKNVNVISGANPADYVVTEPALTHFAEVKSSVNKTSFTFSNIKPNQWKAARRTTAAGGAYYFYLLDLNTDEWYRVPAETMLQFKDEGLKSVKWLYLRDHLWYPVVDKPTNH